MRIFISWSDQRSQAVAAALKSWLEDTLVTVDIFMSTDIPAGQKWFSQLLGELHCADYCIVCMTPENMRSPWLLFETGAIAARSKETRISCYLLELLPEQLAHHPLYAFQAVRANRKGTAALVRSILEAGRSRSPSSAEIETLMDGWSNLWDAILEIPASRPSDFERHQFRIRNCKYDKFLEVCESRRDDGAPLSLVDRNEEKSQQWTLREAAQGFFSIRAVHSDRCLDVKSVSMKPSAVVHQWNFTGADNQQWRLDPSQSGGYRIAAKHSGLRLHAASREEIIQAEVSESDRQRWELDPV